MMMMRMKMRMVMGIPMLLLLPRLLSSSPPPPPPPPRIAGLSRRRPAQTQRPTALLLLPCRGPTLRLPRPPTARPPAQTPIRRLADLTGWAGAAPGCGETAERGPDGTRRHGELRAPHPAPRPGRCPSAPPPSLFLFIYFPVEKEKPLLAASGRSPHTGCAPQDAAPGAALGARPGGARSPRAPRSPRGGGRSPAAGALPFPPPRVCGSGRCRRGEPRAPRGMGRREGAEFSAVCEGDKVWGAWPLSSGSGWNSCGRSGRGGLPGQGPGWLAACPPGCGAGLSLITRDLTCPGGQRGLGLRGEAGERRGLAAGEKSGHGARKRPRPRTFLRALPQRAPLPAAGAAPAERGRRPGAPAPRAHLTAPAGPQPGRLSLLPSLPGPQRRERGRGADAESRSGAHGLRSGALTRAWRAGSRTSPDLQTWWGAIAPRVRLNTARERVTRGLWVSV
ncbi:uncharacterized protein LOC141730701 [Zonotrichia albicollis]|uniref:uncharacterized protein LOC141730701 n=1 Tax=Zonotrichia albicollis TaxID=44394 RepID=UPI003D80DA0C